MDHCSFIIDDYWLLLMIMMIVLLLLMIICYCNKTNFSSSIYKVIRLVLNFLLFFLQKDFTSTKKHNQYIGFF